MLTDLLETWRQRQAAHEVGKDADRAAELSRCIQELEAALAAPPHPAAGAARVLVAGVNDLVRRVYIATQRKPHGIKIEVDSDVFRDVAASGEVAVSRGARSPDPGMAVYRANGETCVDVMTSIGPVTVTESVPRIAWRGGRF